ncbi:hypothetical protein JKP88DRAFT_348567 [Tribonema minus]|uniref:DUF1754-domain-containing protein n=1 Tax=Tribonema minus TaxID=303371 RepID=A0A836CFW3_9STRA|nr:hypothetical protein JKP88DRAFT_348567 [Tribonema minus]
MVADSYSSVVGGKLSLKTKSLFKGNKKRKAKKAEDGAGQSSEPAAPAQAAAQEEQSEGKQKQQRETEVDPDEFLTPAQKRYKQQKASQDEKRIKAIVKMTHRDRIEEFNSTLASMTEHNDIPRISAAGNG